MCVILRNVERSTGSAGILHLVVISFPHYKMWDGEGFPQAADPRGKYTPFGISRAVRVPLPGVEPGTFALGVRCSLH